jgi:hypothetical protein
VTPKTFKEAVDGLILEWNISQTKKRMPDQSYSSIEGTIFSLGSMLTKVQRMTFRRISAFCGVVTNEGRYLYRPFYFSGT